MNTGFNQVTINVPAEGPARSYNGNVYGPGTSFQVPRCIAHLYMEEAKVDTPKACFPQRKCNADGSWDYSNVYANQYVLTAETETIVTVPVIPGCARPSSAELFVCGGGCVIANLDAPATLPTSDTTGGIAQLLNPTNIDLCMTESARAIENIHLISPVDQVVNVYFWGNCCT